MIKGVISLLKVVKRLLLHKKKWQIILFMFLKINYSFDAASFSLTKHILLHGRVPDLTLYNCADEKVVLKPIFPFKLELVSLPQLVVDRDGGAARLRRRAHGGGHRPRRRGL